MCWLHPPSSPRSPALATTYGFSYSFRSTGNTVNGSFEAAGGDGVYVNTVGIGNIVKRNGVALDGSLISNIYDNGGWAAAPVIFFAYDKNAFIFSNGAQQNCASRAPAHLQLFDRENGAAI